MGTWIKPDVIYGDGSPVILPSPLSTSGSRGPRGKAGPQGERGPKGDVGGVSEYGWSVANAVFSKDVDTFFGPDGDLKTGLAGELTGGIVASQREYKYLTVTCNPVVADAAVTLKVWASPDNGANWGTVASVQVSEGQRTATAELNLSVGETLLCVSVLPEVADYTGPVSWLLHN